MCLNIISYTPFVNKFKIVQTGIKRYCKKRVQSDKENIVFYLNLALKKEDELMRILNFDECDKNNIIIQSYLQQIIEVSKIAVTKVMFFEYTLGVGITYIIIMIIFSCINFLSTLVV